jgi:hypothetical protein
VYHNAIEEVPKVSEVQVHTAVHEIVLGDMKVCAREAIKMLQEQTCTKTPCVILATKVLETRLKVVEWQLRLTWRAAPGDLAAFH